MSEPGGNARKFRPFRRIRKLVKRLARRSGGERPRPPADRGYILCATARTGSTYFGRLLSSTRVLGVPREYFERTARLESDPGYPDDPRLQLDIVRSSGATPNGIYAVKLLAPHLATINGVIDPFRDLPNVKLVRLRRRDRLGQAISLVRAEQTGKFGSERSALPPRAYDREQIRTCLRTIADQEALWDEIMARMAAQPLEFEYETLTQDPQLAVDRVAALMGIGKAAPIRWNRVGSMIQRDAISDTWRHRFLEETGDEFGYLARLATPPSPPDSASAS